MSDFVNATPRTVNELYNNLLKLHENRKHIDSMEINTVSNRLEVDLSWKANKLGGAPDFYVPIKANKIQEAKALVERFMSSAKHQPTMTEADLLFKMVDTNG